MEIHTEPSETVTHTRDFPAFHPGRAGTHNPVGCKPAAHVRWMARPCGMAAAPPWPCRSSRSMLRLSAVLALAGAIPPPWSGGQILSVGPLNAAEGYQQVGRGRGAKMGSDRCKTSMAKKNTLKMQKKWARTGVKLQWQKKHVKNAKKNTSINDGKPFGKYKIRMWWSILFQKKKLQKTACSFPPESTAKKNAVYWLQGGKEKN